MLLIFLFIACYAISLFFFFFFLQCSYERNYKILLDAMIKNDLALKGKFGGVELLILPSNQLPEKSQRKELCEVSLYCAGCPLCASMFDRILCAS